MRLSERKLKILSAAVELYILTGEPVGSKAICDTLDTAVSSATVRNELAELSEMGLLMQPHTSAGRVPSPAGYRLYIDSLSGKDALTQTEKSRISLSIKKFDDPSETLEQAVGSLAELTQCACVSTTPFDRAAFVKKVELVQLEPRTVMLALLSSTGICKTVMCRTVFPLSEEAREVFSNFLDQKICGAKLSKLSRADIQTMALELGAHSLILSPLLAGLSQVAQRAAETGVIMNGQTKLLGDSRLALDDIRLLMDFLGSAQPIAAMLSQMANLSERPTGINLRVLLGKESGYSELGASSVVAAKYEMGGSVQGHLGVIGPVRMNYAKIIPCVEYFAAELSKILYEDLQGGNAWEQQN